ncbi:MAG: hypothetical protein KME52_09415 [Desmonostoc geniculatum HA4340-LM1]|nr:hypothetical protein [Desmonostoc geniculatum HA4340-LM1]
MTDTNKFLRSLLQLILNCDRTTSPLNYQLLTMSDRSNCLNARIVEYNY